MTTAIMVDLETLSTRHDAAILSIGAVIFDPFIPGEIGATFETTISMASNAALNRHIDPGTVQWWLQQTPEAQAALLGGQQFQLTHALGQFRDWVIAQSPSQVWANSPSFDCVILRSAFDAAGLRTPWNYYVERDVRTMKEILTASEVEPPAPAGIAHRAVDDCLKQIGIVQTAFQLALR